LIEFESMQVLLLLASIQIQSNQDFPRRLQYSCLYIYENVYLDLQTNCFLCRSVDDNAAKNFNVLAISHNYFDIPNKNYFQICFSAKSFFPRKHKILFTRITLRLLRLINQPRPDAPIYSKSTRTSKIRHFDRRKDLSSSRANLPRFPTTFNRLLAPLRRGAILTCARSEISTDGNTRWHSCVGHDRRTQSSLFLRHDFPRAERETRTRSERRVKKRPFTARTTDWLTSKDKRHPRYEGVL